MRRGREVAENEEGKGGGMEGGWDGRGKEGGNPRVTAVARKEGGNPRVTAVARKRPRSFCQKRRWQVTAKHAYTLRMWLCMK